MVPLGVIADSDKTWRFGPGRLQAYLRIRKANKELAKRQS